MIFIHYNGALLAHLPIILMLTFPWQRKAFLICNLYLIKCYRASFDSTVRLWEIERGVCLHTLRRHQDPVYSVSYSPDGLYIASGSFDKWLYIWSTVDGSLIRQFQGDSGIFDVCWNNDGTKLAASFADNKVSLLLCNILIVIYQLGLCARS